MAHFSGRYSLRPIAYRIFDYIPDAVDPFAFTTAAGDRIEPGPMETDGASTPRILWAIPGFDPMDWINGAVIHDWLYELHHAGHPEITFEFANQVLGECLTVLGVAHWKRRLILAAVRTFGRCYWDRPTNGAK